MRRSLAAQGRDFRVGSASNHLQELDTISLRGDASLRSAAYHLPELLARLLPDSEWLRGATLRYAVCHGTRAAEDRRSASAMISSSI
ncbi:MAG: hypothetical protein ACOCXA_04955, partial [Planctomycetota bacterium]